MQKIIKLRSSGRQLLETVNFAFMKIFDLLTLFYPGSGKMLLPGGGPLWPPPGFLALGPPKAQNWTLAHFWA